MTNYAKITKGEWKEDYIEKWRIAFDTKFNMLGLNRTVKKLGMNIRRKIDVNIDLI